MILVKVVNNEVSQYPYSIGMLRKDNPSTSFPKNPTDTDLATFGVFRVLEETPTVSSSQKLIYADTPTLVGGQWVLQHQAVPKTVEDLATETKVAENNLRTERNRLLTATDFFALTDVTMSPDMTAYRQALRDVPTQVGFPSDITWPTKP